MVAVFVNRHGHPRSQVFLDSSEHRLRITLDLGRFDNVEHTPSIAHASGSRLPGAFRSTSQARTGGGAGVFSARWFRYTAFAFIKAVYS